MAGGGETKRKKVAQLKPRNWTVCNVKAEFRVDRTWGSIRSVDSSRSVGSSRSVEEKPGSDRSCFNVEGVNGRQITEERSAGNRCLVERKSDCKSQQFNEAIVKEKSSDKQERLSIDPDQEGDRHQAAEQQHSDTTELKQSKDATDYKVFDKDTRLTDKLRNSLSLAERWHTMKTLTTDSETLEWKETQKPGHRTRCRKGPRNNQLKPRDWALCNVKAEFKVAGGQQGEESVNGLSTWYDRLKKNLSTTARERAAVEEREELQGEEEHLTDGLADSPEEGEDDQIFWTVGQRHIEYLARNWIRALEKRDIETLKDLDGKEENPVNHRKACRTDPYHSFNWHSRHQWQYDWEGDTDEEGRFTGRGLLCFKDGGEIGGDWLGGKREGRCSSVCPSRGIAQLVGNYTNDRLCGLGRILMDDGTVVEGYFRDGCLHGLVKESSESEELQWVGRYLHGARVGRATMFMRGGGIVTGQVDPEGELTGDNIAYVYPDWSTCLVGSFEKGVMLCAREAVLQAAAVYQGVLHIQTSRPDGPTFRYEPSTYEFVCEDLKLQDPYEAKVLECRPSSLSTAGDGIFTKRDVPHNTVLAFYNGVKIPNDVGDETETWEDCSYRIFLKQDTEDGERLDIPKHLVSIDSYSASLAHKVNHSFTPNCKFSKIEHPRFGLVPCVVSTQSIEAGRELFCYYKYLLNDCPEWYSNLWGVQGQHSRT